MSTESITYQKGLNGFGLYIANQVCKFSVSLYIGLPSVFNCKQACRSEFESEGAMTAGGGGGWYENGPKAHSL